MEIAHRYIAILKDNKGELVAVADSADFDSYDRAFDEAYKAFQNDRIDIYGFDSFREQLERDSWKSLVEDRLGEVA